MPPRKQKKSSVGKAPENIGPAYSLLAVVGVSPAILTETVWALAFPEDGSPAIIPDEVVAITTLTGKKAIEENLLAPCPEFGGASAWKSLRERIVAPSCSGDLRLCLEIRTIKCRDAKTGTMRELDDIRTKEENLATAEYILDQVRGKTSSSDRRLIASIAGGRKTMGALLHAAFSHLGRPEDRLTHVLVSEPFENPRLKPRFFYPGQPAQTLITPEGEKIRASDARLELAYVPFVPLRARFPEIAEIPTRFSGLVEKYLETFKQDASKPAIVELLKDPPRVVVDGISIELESERQFEVIDFVLQANLKEWLRKDQPEALEIFKAWHGYTPVLTNIRPALRETIRKLYEGRESNPGATWIQKATTDDIKRPVSFLRTEIFKKSGRVFPASRTLCYPPFKLMSHAS